MDIRKLLIIAVWMAVFATAQAQQADHPFQINSADGKSNLFLGFLGQGQAELIKNETGINNSQDLFLRRFRLIAGGNVNDKLAFFIDTDSANLGKRSSGIKGDDRIFLQDVIITYKFRPEFQLDAGLLLLPLTHNTGQGATTLMALDYGPYSFLASTPTESRVGRDYGLQVRGYLAKNHFEYRLGVFQGSRTASGGNSFRTFGRAVLYPFEAETSFFYTGTTLGAKKILAIGASIDHQKRYTTESADIFYDQPLPGKNSLTLQGAFSHYDGGKAFIPLPRQNVWFIEAGFYNKKSRLGPFFQAAGRNFTTKSRNDLAKYTGGLAYWHSGHRLNVKLGVSRATGDPTQDFWQVVAQAQIYVY